MKNWSTDEEALKRDPEAYTIWKLEQLVNYGVGDEKISKSELIKYWNRIHVDPARRKFLSLLIYA